MEDNVSVQEVEAPKKNLKLILIIIAILLFLVSLLIGIYISYKAGVFNNVFSYFNNEETTETEEQVYSPTEYLFVGESITAVLPNEWSIAEYYNGEGTETLMDDLEYEGLTGLKVMFGDREVFSFRAVSGIGTVGCPMYVKFSDYNPQHLEEMIDINEETGTEMNVTDYTQAGLEYSEFKFLDKTFRRVGTSYYHDIVDNNDFFEPTCMTGLISSIEGFSFVDSYGYTGDSYFYGPVNEVYLSELEIVDSILGSMKLIQN